MLGGCDISSLNPVNVAKKIGIVFQDHSVPFPYPVIEVVRMGRAPHLSVFASPSQEDTEIAEEMLETVGIYHLKDKPYTQISGGERQLTLIARTLTQQPEIILLDEPTSHLDFRNQVLILNIIDKLSQSGFSIIMSSHFPNHVLSLSSKVALMNTGRFIAVGQAEEVMTEGNLKETYGIEVQVISYKDPQTNESMRLCIPKKL